MAKGLIHPISIIFKIDKRGIRWRKNSLLDEWICCGQSKEQRQINALNNKKKELELKRLKMLIY